MIYNPYNYIFHFDKYEVARLKKNGVSNVFHLPLAVNMKRINTLLDNNPISDNDIENVTFMGNMYASAPDYEYLYSHLDDYLKVVLKRSDGLMPMQKMALQIIVTAVFAFYLVKVADIPLTMLVPFSNGYYLDIGWMAVPLLFVAVIGTVNGTNFTDGLDGLASSVTVLVATFFTVVAIGTKSGIEPVTCAVVGALLGFLLFNVYPASVFMGDTGSLALGGFVAGTAYMMQMPLFILIVGIIYLVEVASVMIQVTYFKKTGGKRFFKMAPIHHHFELCGWSETRVVAVFSIITALLCLIALMGV